MVAIPRADAVVPGGCAGSGGTHVTLAGMRCSFAEWVPWKPAAPDGRPTYYAGQNRPSAVVLHVMQGYQRTARRWAESGHFGQSWHYSVGRDGSIMQHLDHADGGYHAGITAAKARAFPPTWALWRGAATNVNHYTIGIEHEGFAGEQFTLAQAAASRRLCHWLAGERAIPLDPDHFAPHAVIDLRDRAHDFNTPTLREDYYAFLFATEATMDPQTLAQLQERVDRLERIAGGHGIDHEGQRLRDEAALASLDERGVSLALYADNLNAAIHRHLAEHEDAEAI